VQSGVSEQTLALAEQLPHLAAEASAASLASGRLCFPAVGSEPATGRQTAVWLAHVRLPRVATDLVLTLHAAEGNLAPTILRTLASLRVLDWDLFGQ
jgi:hypothetical protein